MRVRTLTLVVFVATWAALAAPAVAGPQPPPDYSFNGAVALQGCSGALFRFAGQSLDDRALVLTNGHCIGTLKAYQVLVAEPTEREVELFNNAGERSAPYVASEIVYATMHQTDMAILRMDVSYQQLKDDHNVDALVLAAERGNLGEDVVIVSGFWEYTTACALEAFVPEMRESRWTWFDSLKFSADCVTFGGTSGSPVISVTSGQIIGVNNTGYEGGEPCTFNNPCEVDDSGSVSVETDGSYGQQTYALYSCIDANYDLDLSLPGCALPVQRGVLQISGAVLAANTDCDLDGIVDAGETGTLLVTIFNDGPVDLSATSLTVTTSDASLELVAGSSVQVGAVAGLQTAVVEIPIALGDVTGVDNLTIELRARDPESAEPEVSATAVLRVNYDELPQSTTTDDVESATSPWTTATELADDPNVAWTRTIADAPNTVWRARGHTTFADQRLESPPLQVGDGDFVVTLSHRYRFESSPPSDQRPDPTYWDGAVIELSTDGGTTWVDASTYASIAYAGTITDESGNPLAGRQAFVAASPGWPKRQPLELDFGTALAGETVLLRFRVGSDAGAGDFGWELDDIAVAGVTNTPFSQIVDDATECGGDPGPTDPEAGCGCRSSNNSGAATWLVGLLLLALGLRRRSAAATTAREHERAQ